MARKHEDDIIADLVAAGVLLLVGYGLYRLVRSAFALEAGQVVDEKSIIQAVSDKREPSVCTKCGTTDPEKCNKGHCMVCVAEKTCGAARCYCGKCLECYGWAGGNECNVCSD